MVKGRIMWERRTYGGVDDGRIMAGTKRLTKALDGFSLASILYSGHVFSLFGSGFLDNLAWVRKHGKASWISASFLYMMVYAWAWAAESSFGKKGG